MRTTEIIINRDAYYTIADASKLIGLSRERLTAEFKAGKLHASKRGQRIFIRGQWLVDWLEADAATEGKPRG